MKMNREELIRHINTLAQKEYVLAEHNNKGLESVEVVAKHIYAGGLLMKIVDEALETA